MSKFKLGPEEYMGEHRCMNCGTINDVASAVTVDDKEDIHELAPGDLLICTKCGYLMSVDDDLQLRELTIDEEKYWKGHPQLLEALSILRFQSIGKDPIKH